MRVRAEKGLRVRAGWVSRVRVRAEKGLNDEG